MADLTKLRDIEKRLAEDPGPARFTDGDLIEVLGLSPVWHRRGARYIRHPDYRYRWTLHHDSGAVSKEWNAPKATGSVDVAIALVKRVLPGWIYRICECSVSDDAYVMPDFNHPEHGARFLARFPDEAQRDPLVYFNSDVDQRPPGRPAQALCLAMVRALIVIEEKHNG